MSAHLPKARSMQAAVYRRYGSPDELKLETLAIPTAAEGQVLVKVHACTVNRTDCSFLRGKPFIVRFFSGLLKPNANILGCEFAGEVIELGQGVEGFAVGDRVCGFKDDDFGFGGQAQYTAMPVRSMITHMPDGFSYSEAAPALEGAHYALHYVRASGLCQGQTILINGGTGAIGSAAVQLFKVLGVHVTAVCAGEHCETVKALGADRVIDYQKADFTALDQQFDVVFDAVGKSSFARCKNILKPDGIYMSTELGSYCQNPFLAILTRFVGTQKVLFPMPENSKEDAEYLAQLMLEGAYKPLIDRSYALSEIADAYRYVEQGMKVGNVVIEMGDE